MRRIALWALSTLPTLVLLLGYHTSTSGALTVASGTGQSVITASVPTGTSASPSSGTSSGVAEGGATGGTGATAATTVTGSSVQTRYGPVQVAVSVLDGELTSVSVLQYPAGNHEDEQINGYALPILVDETISAQGSDIDMVSGATYTSEGYLRSLQSALDQAGL